MNSLMKLLINNLLSEKKHSLIHKLLPKFDRSPLLDHQTSNVGLSNYMPLCSLLGFHPAPVSNFT